jgi:hypothetical protein
MLRGPHAEEDAIPTGHEQRSMRGPVILARFIPPGDSPSYAAPLIVDSLIFLAAPVVFIVGWATARKYIEAGTREKPGASI